MEQKKILWIIAAVGVFLLVVLGAACILYSPGKMNPPVVASVSPVEKKSSDTKSGWKTPSVDFNNDDLLPPAPVAIPQDVVTEANEVIVYAENATVYGTNTTTVDSNGATTIDLNALKETSLQPQNINVNVTVNTDDKDVAKTYRPEQPKQSRPAKQSAPKDESKVNAAENKTAKAAAPAEKTKPVETPKSAPKTAPAKTTSKPVAAAPKPAVKEEPKKVQYWVQVAAYSSKKGAEEARESLDENKIPADIFTYRDSKDRLFYRVRVGPYTTKSEAEYWRQKIEAISEFANQGSYITAN